MIRTQWKHAVGMGLALTAFVTVLAIQASSRPAPTAPSSDEVQIRSVLETQTAAWNRGDITAFMDGYWKSDQTVFVGPNGILRGWQTLLERYQQRFPNHDAMGKLSFSNLEIHLPCPDAAYAIAEYHLQQANDTHSGVFTLEFRRFHEGWRIVVDHSTPYADKNQPHP